MDPRSHGNHCEGVMAFSVQDSPNRPEYHCGSYPVHGTRVIPQLLNLFPSSPVLHPSKKRDSAKSFSRQEAQQMPDADKDVVNRSDSELVSQNHAGTPLLILSIFRASKSVPEETTFQKPVKKPRSTVSSVPYRAPPPPRAACVDSVCHQSSWTPSMARSDISSRISSERRSANPLKGASTLKTRKTNRSGSASSAGASVQNVTPSTHTITSSQHKTTALGNGPPDDPKRPSKRHGPRPKSSPYRGVTHYKRTGRWEAHIWTNGRQIYLGASSTSIRAARAYDRAAIHFRSKDAELNFQIQDYEEELDKLRKLSDIQLINMLRKQSAKKGLLHPVYPPTPELGDSSNVTTVRIKEGKNHRGRPRGRPRSFVAKAIPHATQFFPSNSQGFRSCGSSSGTMAQSLQPLQGESSSVLETIPHRAQVDPSYLRGFRAYKKPVRNIAQSPPEPLSTLHVPKAGHVSERTRQFFQVIDNMIAEIQSSKE